MACRGPFYEKAAEVQIDTSVMDVEEVVEAVLSILPPHPSSLPTGEGIG